MVTGVSSSTGSLISSTGSSASLNETGSGSTASSSKAGTASIAGAVSNTSGSAVGSTATDSPVTGFISKACSEAPQSGQNVNLSANPSSQELQYFNIFPIFVGLST